MTKMTLLFFFVYLHEIEGWSVQMMMTLVPEKPRISDQASFQSYQTMSWTLEKNDKQHSQQARMTNAQ